LHVNWSIALARGQLTWLSNQNSRPSAELRIVRTSPSVSPRRPEKGKGRAHEQPRAVNDLAAPRLSGHLGRVFGICRTTFDDALAGGEIDPGMS
jgi:hypothetical protein